MPMGNLQMPNLRHPFIKVQKAVDELQARGVPTYNIGLSCRGDQRKVCYVTHSKR